MSARAVWYRTESAVASAVLRVLGLVPARLALLLGRGAARVFFVLARRRRRIAIDNIRRAGIRDDRPGARRLALASMDTVATVVVESILARRRLSAENWSEHVRLDMPRAAEELLREPGKGVIVATAHVGNWELVARAVSMAKPVCAIYKPFRNPYLNRALHAGRSGEQLRLITKYDDDPLRLVKALSNGEILAIMIDQHARGGLRVEFFGRPASTTPSVALLHLVTRAPLLVAYAVRRGPLRYDVHAIGPLRFARTGDRERDVLEITQALTRHVEEIARRHPEQYMWGHRRWK